MAARTFNRDSQGRFARTAAAGDRAAAKQAEADAREVEQARFRVKANEALLEIDAARKQVRAAAQLKEDAHTDTEFLEAAIARKKARDAERRAKATYKQLQQAARAKR